ncbi:MAG: hypothetical protein H7A23_24255 [Leptospiraceae bacterium]|nr:hypothetical protein [Leptospiraceae bacterium]
MTKSDFVQFVCTSLILVFFVFLNYTVLPLSWPDEALFSSPASNLAINGSFSTPVLKGLVPGMDKVTLWNSPLYMLVVSFAYKLAGNENQFLGRAVSLLQGILVLFVFLQIIKLFVNKMLFRWVLLLGLVFDLTFIRSSNTLRMDMQTLLFVLLTVWILVRKFLLYSQIEKTEGDKYYFVLAGVFTGLAAISHPFAVILIPIWFVLVVPRLLPFVYGFVGFVISFSTWLVYILPNFEIFKEQFLAQMERKPDLFRLWGGDTGGIFVVFSSQYGNKPIMILALLVYALLCVYGFFQVVRVRKKFFQNETVRMYFVFMVMLLFILVSSESWYILYAGTFGLLFLATLLDKDNKSHVIAYIFVAFFIISNLNFIARTHLIQKLPRIAEQFLQTALLQAKGCKTIYLRTRPDPYFVLRKHYPEMEVLEFIPGKLRFYGMDSLISRYNEIDCFLLDENDSWEPKLTVYLHSMKDKFQLTSQKFRYSVSDLNLWRRR